MLNANAIDSVCYFYETTPERVTEACNSSLKYKFTPIFVGVDIYRQLEHFVTHDTTLFVPSVTDLHADHKTVNRVGRTLALETGCELVFYTVDMTSGYQAPLSEKDRQLKKEDLLSLFPSQAALFENEKYWLFEGYSETETVVKRTYQNNITLSGYQLPDNLTPAFDDHEGHALLDRLVVEYFDGHYVQTITVKTETGDELTYGIR